MTEWKKLKTMEDENGYEMLLGMKDHYEISRCLDELDNQQIVQVGLALGMNYAKLKRMQSIPGDMVAAWLRREGDVLGVSGVPTWKALSEALKDVGQTGLAMKIQQKQHGTCTKTLKAQEGTTTKSQPQSEQNESSTRSAPILQVSDSVSMKNLTLIKWKDTQDKQHKLRIVQSICPKWRIIGNLLNISDSVLESMLSQYRGDLEECCYAVTRQWLDNGSPGYPVTWEGLMELLEDADCAQVAEELRKALDKSHTTVL